ncbi:sigma-54 interaction domain-containing protein [Pseudogracilibacillus sp. SO30301A]|uniref:sigma-54 interaction domain-containing protein n=1 Tax=Pseudogracilibacillus sp. SO30301A TaxID=3098291 RepID=UPI00300E3B10
MIEKYKEEIIDTIVEKLFYGLVIVDDKGIITYLNDNYCQFLQVDKQEAVGQHVKDIIENSRMHLVVKKGKAEMFDPQYIRGNYMVASRIPLISNNKVVGALGVVLFRDMHDLTRVNSQINHLLAEVKYYKDQLQAKTGIKYSINDIIGSSKSILMIKEKIKKISPSDLSVLITGESGTGKELVAQSIHQLSNRNKKPFISVNCAAIPEHLFESELFGYEEGAFTGARKGGKKGKFQSAEGGTLFLDEIGDMPLKTQVKLLRVLQEEEIDALGAETPQKIDVRVIAATNQPLDQLVREKRFREDLFYRINVMEIHLPPLRKRPEDIKIMANYLLTKITNKIGKRVIHFSDDVMDLFLNYAWPGNIRELENIIESAVYLSSGETIDLIDLPTRALENQVEDTETYHLHKILKDTERRTIQKVLQLTRNGKKAAAKKLGISLSSIYEKIKEYDL